MYSVDLGDTYYLIRSKTVKVRAEHIFSRKKVKVINEKKY